MLTRTPRAPNYARVSHNAPPEAKQQKGVWMGLPQVNLEGDQEEEEEEEFT